MTEWSPQPETRGHECLRTSCCGCPRGLRGCRRGLRGCRRGSGTGACGRGSPCGRSSPGCGRAGHFTLATFHTVLGPLERKNIEKHCNLSQ